MTKKYSIFIAAIFCLFIFGFGIALFLSPDKTFSEQENRYLAQFKAPTFETLKSGEFMEDFEDYITDQFPLRDWWINLKARGEKLLGKQENNNVYFGTDGQSLFAQYSKPADLDKRVEYINSMAGKTEIPVYFALIPDKSYVWADRLPDNAPKVDDGSTLTQAAGLVSDRVNWVDLGDALEGGDAFYRTDHHWTTMGAFQAYKSLMHAMNGFAITPKDELTQVSDRFYGTTWSSSGAGWIAPDAIHIWVDESRVEVERYPEGKPVKGELYDESFLDKKDKYSMFLGGNQPLCVLKNENAATDKKIMVLRDSYSDSIAPFLALQYAEVHLVDLRYYKMPPHLYAQQNGMDQILVLYSNANFATDQNLFIMGMG